MSDTVSVAELEAQQVELLPARTVLSTFTTKGEGGTSSGKGFSLSPTALLGLTGNGYGAPGTNADGYSGTSES